MPRRLLVDIVGGEVGPIQEAVSHREHLPARPDVVLRASRIEKMLGFALAPARWSVFFWPGSGCDCDGGWLDMQRSQLAF